ncbi:hypothetical protein B0H19DRAFT_1146597, partial [Mycena capillaripes]
SGSCPLSIQIEDYEDDVLEICTSEALAVAVTHCERWEYIRLHTYCSFPTIEGLLPLLRHLDVEFDDSPSNAVVLEAPLLRTVILSSVDVSNVTLPWAGLTSLTLTRLNPDSCVPILQQTPNLVHCELKLYDFDYDPSLPPSVVTLPYLESFVCTNLDIGLYDGYLGTIITPALRSLHVSEPFLWPNPSASLTSFISNSGCTLQEVCIMGTRSIRNSGVESDSESGDVESDSDSD